MAILADVTVPGGMTHCKVYIAPRYISANRDAGHYALDYLLTKGGLALPLPPELSVLEFALNGPARPGRVRTAGVIYDRDKPAHEQVYADLRAKALAGELPWLANVCNEDGSPFVEAPRKPEDAPAAAAPVDAPALDVATAEAFALDDAKPDDEQLFPGAAEPTLYVPDFTIIPDALAKYAEADESADDFRKRAFSLLFRFGIAEGDNFEGGGEPLTPEEKIRLLPMLIANFNAGNWLKLTEDLNPQALDDGIPREFRNLMLDGENPKVFAHRMRQRWLTLSQMQADDASGTLPDLNADELAEWADLAGRNNTTKWLD